MSISNYAIPLPAGLFEPVIGPNGKAIVTQINKAEGYVRLVSGSTVNDVPLITFAEKYQKFSAQK
jgi:hypothetical protein